MSFESMENPVYLRIVNSHKLGPFSGEIPTFEESKMATEFILVGDEIKPNPDSRYSPLLEKVFPGIKPEDERNDYANISPRSIIKNSNGNYEINN